MAKRTVVTSWSDKGYDQYGHLFLRSWLEHWKDVPLVVFHEGKTGLRVCENVTFIDLRDDPELKDFHQKYGGNPAANGVVQRQDGKLVVDYRYQANKFARKVFAVSSPVRPATDWWIWIDADVVFKKAPDEHLWEVATPDGKSGSYIGRQGWPHSECGWVAYKLPDCEDFLDRFRHVYANGHVFRFPEWHDSYIFDQLRFMLDPGDRQWVNIAAGIKEEGGVPHPWPNTILGQYMDHHKGPQAKREFYGP